MARFKIAKIPKSRIATIDICEIGLKKHHVAAFMEFDVTESREKIKSYKKEVNNISFTAWLIKAISHTIKKHEIIAGYLKGKNKMVIFDDINVSMTIEKKLNDEKLPFPVLFKKANECSIEFITKQLNNSINQNITGRDIVLQRKTKRLEQLYYYLPGFMRRYFWNYLLKHPKPAFAKMGNVAFTSIGMIGNINGWFIPISIHPVCFGVGPVIKKPVVIDDKIEIREILNMTILLDHNVIDGAPMARFIKELSVNLKDGVFL